MDKEQESKTAGTSRITFGEIERTYATLLLGALVVVLQERHEPLLMRFKKRPGQPALVMEDITRLDCPPEGYGAALRMHGAEAGPMELYVFMAEGLAAEAKGEEAAKLLSGECKVRTASNAHAALFVTAFGAGFELRGLCPIDEDRLLEVRPLRLQAAEHGAIFEDLGDKGVFRGA